MNLPGFYFPQLVDEFARKNFTMLADFLRGETPLLGFRRIEQTFTGPETRAVPHGLGFQPEDAWVSFVSAGTAVLNYDKFDAAQVTISVTTACKVRFFVGTYRQGGGK